MTLGSTASLGCEVDDPTNCGECGDSGDGLCAYEDGGCGEAFLGVGGAIYVLASPAAVAQQVKLRVQPTHQVGLIRGCNGWVIARNYDEDRIRQLRTDSRMIVL